MTTAAPAAAAAAATFTGPARQPPAAPTAARAFFLDWLRILAFALLIPYHVGMVYVRWPYHFKTAQPVPGLEPWLLATNPWRMSLLFLVSGAATAFMLARSGPGHGPATRVAPTGAWLRQRLRRLGGPLLVGVLVIVPPQAWLQVRQQFVYTGGYLDFLGLYLTGYHGFCDAQRQCLVLPTWNHLWFLPYLAAYTALLWALLRRRPQALDAAAAALPRLLAGTALVAAPVAWLVVARLALGRRFPETHALVDDWALHAQFLPTFLLGAALARSGALWPRIAAGRHVWLALALAGWGGVLLGRASAPAAPWPVLAVALQQWCAILAALGYARQHLDHDHRWRARLTGWVFPLYLVHQTVIVGLAALLVDRGLPQGLEGALLLVASVVGSVAIVALIERLPALWRWTGMSGPGARTAR